MGGTGRREAVMDNLKDLRERVAHAETPADWAQIIRRIELIKANVEQLGHEARHARVIETYDHSA